MLVLDSTVLSSFIKLGLLEKLANLLSPLYITKEIFTEYQTYGVQDIQQWVSVTDSKEDQELGKIPSSLSKADLSVIRLALENNYGLASDDRSLRKTAQQLGILVTGSLGLLKELFKSKIIESKSEYIDLLNQLQQDIYLSDELLRWALE